MGLGIGSWGLTGRVFQRPASWTLSDLQPRREAVRAGPHERARFGSSKTRLQREGRAGLGTQRGSQGAMRKARFSALAVAAPEQNCFPPDLRDLTKSKLEIRSLNSRARLDRGSMSHPDSTLIHDVRKQ